MPGDFFHSDRTFAELSESLLSADPAVRWAAILELGGRDEQWAEELISSCLNDHDERVASSAHHELGLVFEPETHHRKAKNHPKEVRPALDFEQILHDNISKESVLVERSPFALELILREAAGDHDNSITSNDAPFPQADNFNRLLGMVNLCINEPMDLQSLVAELRIDERQVGYYLAASKYLGFLNIDGGSIDVFPQVKGIFSELDSRPANFFFEISKFVLRVPSVAEVFLSWTRDSLEIDRNTSIEALLKSGAGLNLSASTIARRSKTVSSWAGWIRKNLDTLQDHWESVGNLVPEPIPNFERATATISSLDERDAMCFFRRNKLFTSDQDKTLEAVGREFGLSRERVRQIEKGINERVLADIDGGTNWDWRSDLQQYIYDHPLFDSAHLICKISPDKSGEAIAHTVLSAINCEQIGISKRFWTPKGSNLSEIIETVRTLTPMSSADWLENVEKLGLSPEFLLWETNVFENVSGLVVDRKKRREQIVMHHLQRVGSDSEKALALACGESASRSFSNALHLNGSFRKNRATGHWELAETSGKGEEERFSTVYEAAVFTLRTYGPMKSSEFQSYMSQIYPVSSSRVIQALDYFEIGKLTDGRIALLSQGGRRPPGLEPKRPNSGLWVENSEVHINKSVDFDIFRGSGFMLPTWLQWYFGLEATPEFRTFSPTDTTVRELVLTRRGGQSFSSSIKDSLTANQINLGCEITIVLSSKDMTWRLLHNDGCHLETGPNLK